MRKTTKRIAVIAATSAFAIGGVGAAWAAWSSTGSGSGDATAATASTVDATPVTISGVLFPGASRDLVVNFANDNPYPVKITSLTPSLSIDAAHVALGCTAGASGVTVDALPTAAIANVPEKVGAVKGSLATPVTFTNVVHMSNASVNACQGATFTVSLAVSADSAAS